MKIAVWFTGHEIADRIGHAIYQSLIVTGHKVDPFQAMCEGRDEVIAAYDLHIGYGILRGMDGVFHACTTQKKPWFNVDRGYWKPHHYDGYYRVSLGGTQQTTGLERLEPDYARFDRLLLGNHCLLPRHEFKTLICPPTDYVRQFFGVEAWSAVEHPDSIIRPKNCSRALQADLNRCSKVVTFNSSVGWHALAQGIEVISDDEHSILGAYQKTVAKDLHITYKSIRRFFAVQAALQLTLADIRQGHLWPLMQMLLKASKYS